MVELHWNTKLFIIINVYIFTKSTYGSIIKNVKSTDTRAKDAGNEFNCEVYHSHSIPTSVHSLMPGDIKVTANLGDLVKAGVGVDLTNVTAENRDSTILNDEQFGSQKMTTLPAIFKKYNADLYEYSNGVIREHYGLNSATRQATSEDVVRQAMNLITGLYSDPNVDMKNDWKLITIYTGVNDLCNACYDVERYSAKTYVMNIDKALNKLKAKVPRTFVNVVQVLDVNVLRQIDAKTKLCQSMRHKTCPCIVKDDGLQNTLQLSLEYQKKLAEQIISGKYNTETFTVVLQQHTSEVPLLTDGRSDTSLLASDCTHLNRKGEEQLAITVWANMFTSIGKINNGGNDVKMMCPTKGTYLSTSLNTETYDEINMDVHNEVIKSNTEHHKRFTSHPYYAAILITLFIVMIATVATIVICLTCKDYSKEEKLNLYLNEYDYYFYDKEECY